LAALNEKSLVLLGAALIPGAIGYGLWLRHGWGRKLALFVCWLAVLSPPFLFTGAMFGGRGRDSIGHGFVAAMSIAWLFTLTPLACAVVFVLTRPAARGLFTPDDAALTRTERTVMSVSLAVVLLTEILVLANAPWFDFVLKLL
jgi:hypothetical protein